jgi:uncharacterized membrane protein YjjP (DUF1212 family)
MKNRLNKYSEDNFAIQRLSRKIHNHNLEMEVINRHLRKLLKSWQNYFKAEEEK